MPQRDRPHTSPAVAETCDPVAPAVVGYIGAE